MTGLLDLSAGGVKAFGSPGGVPRSAASALSCGFVRNANSRAAADPVNQNPVRADGERSHLCWALPVTQLHRRVCESPLSGNQTLGVPSAVIHNFESQGQYIYGELIFHALVSPLFFLNCLQSTSALLSCFPHGCAEWRARRKACAQSLARAPLPGGWLGADVHLPCRADPFHRGFETEQSWSAGVCRAPPRFPDDRF